MTLTGREEKEEDCGRLLTMNEREDANDCSVVHDQLLWNVRIFIVNNLWSPNLLTYLLSLQYYL